MAVKKIIVMLITVQTWLCVSSEDKKELTLAVGDDFHRLLPLWAREGRLNMIKVFTRMSPGADQIDSADEHGRTALWYAASAGNIAMVSHLLNCGALCNKADEKGITPAVEASNNGHTEVVNLLSNDIKIEQNGEQKETKI